MSPETSTLLRLYEDAIARTHRARRRVENLIIAENALRDRFLDALRIEEGTMLKTEHDSLPDVEPCCPLPNGVTEGGGVGIFEEGDP